MKHKIQNKPVFISNVLRKDYVSGPPKVDNLQKQGEAPKDEPAKTPVKGQNAAALYKRAAQQRIQSAIQKDRNEQIKRANNEAGSEVDILKEVKQANLKEYYLQGKAVQNKNKPTERLPSK